MARTAVPDNPSPSFLSADGTDLFIRGLYEQNKFLSTFGIENKST
jgi:hypothetical protein